jgi:hypothetical protein
LGRRPGPRRPARSNGTFFTPARAKVGLLGTVASQQILFHQLHNLSLLTILHASLTDAIDDALLAFGLS